MTVISGQIALARAAFCFIRCGIVYRPVRPDDHVEKIVEAKWCGDVEVTVPVLARAEGVHNRRIARERLVGAPKGCVARTEALLEPEMHPSLIANLHRSGQVSQALGYALHDQILGLPAQVAVVKID